MADDYTPSEARICIDFCTAAVRRGRPDGSFMSMEEADAAFSRWLAAHDAQKRAEWEAEQEADDEPCKAEVWSWDIFRHQQVDPYWMRCHLIGPHEKHENSETGATWPVERSGESR